LKKPEIIVPISAHFSFDKAADLLQLKLIKIGLNKNYQVDTKKLRNAITKNTIAIVGVAGSTDLGVVDPINELSNLAMSNGIHLHVDAAFGGFVIPFMKEIGYQIPEFDFKLKGVSSITIDPHKMALAPIPSGGILFRNSETVQRISMRVPYLAGGETLNTTLLGTRSGASAISVWALLKYMGRKKYRKIIEYCMELTKILANEIRKLNNANLIIDPVINVIGFTCHSINNKKAIYELRKRGWALSLFPNHIRIVVMPHLNKQHIYDFLTDLKSTISE
jgi:tyrosine decarboxylase/aspartate 1-decarboxylase